MNKAKQPSEQFHGLLHKMPFPHRPSVAQASMLPLYTDNDFEVFSQFSCSQRPVFLNIPEHLEILSNLAAIASQTWQQVSIIARVSMPAGMRIPVNLLEDNLLLVEDVAQEEALIKQNQHPVLVIEDRFSRIEIENNSNEIMLRLYLPATGQYSTLTPLIDYLHGINVKTIDVTRPEAV